ncbi:MAG TPA: hypothetical protein VMM38_09005 [Aridibacter sp.]|nr:hypothetical protein [Aridibacter sp.]
MTETKTKDEIEEQDENELAKSFIDEIIEETEEDAEEAEEELLVPFAILHEPPESS